MRSSRLFLLAVTLVATVFVIALNSCSGRARSASGTPSEVVRPN